MIDPRARDLIIESEVTSKETYLKQYQRPEWPGGASGVTVAIGYDLGMASKDKIERDWKPHVSPEMLSVMKSCAGISGKNARSKCAMVRGSISIPWEDAIKVFDEVDTPEWEAKVFKTIPKAAELDPIRLGVLVSLAYNRGASFNTPRKPNDTKDRYREMRAIRAAIQEDRLSDVPAQIRAMKRLWDKKTMRGLHVRRDAEADLWEKA
jgi:hypothetical protein